jgi:ankyrin repeat protein
MCGIFHRQINFMLIAFLILSCRSSEEAFLQSARLGHSAAIVEYAETGGNVKARDRFGQTALHLVTRDVNLVRLLVNRGADAKALTLIKQSPLHFCATQGSAESTLLFLELGNDINAEDGFGRTPLDLALEKGQLDVVAVLIDHRARLSKRRVDDGYTPLHFAAQIGDADLIRLLLDRKASISARTKMGKTPADMADSAKVKVMLR